MSTRCHRLAAFALVVLAVAAAGTARGEMLNFTAHLDSHCANNGSPATGSGTFTLDTATGLFNYNITYQNLSSPEMFSHIHGPLPLADWCTNPGGGGVIVTLPNGTPKIGSATLTPQQQQELIDGMYHVNIHTTANPGSEIAGVILLEGMAVPAVSEWGVAAMVLLTVAAATVVYRRWGVPA